MNISFNINQQIKPLKKINKDKDEYLYNGHL